MMRSLVREGDAFIAVRFMVEVGGGGALTWCGKKIFAYDYLCVGYRGTFFLVGLRLLGRRPSDVGDTQRHG